MRTYKGKFRPKNPTKYKGDPTNIIYRSMWEFRVMRQLDEHPQVIQWSSEEVAVPYKSPIDGKFHRYFPDFIVKMKDREGNIKVKMLEIKPAAQSKPPTVRKDGERISKKYITEVARWGINSEKWKSAEEYCKDRGWTFHVITEKDLGIK